MRNPDERAASLALRDGGPEPVRRAIDWYRTHDRLRCGDPIAMAADALAAYRKDVAVGKDALLICDTTEMADALNRRIHDDTIPADAPTVTAARGQRIAVGDLILSRRNDPTIDVCTPPHATCAADRSATVTAGASPPSTRDESRCRRTPRRPSPRRLRRRLRPRARHPRLRHHRALRPRRHRGHHPRRTRREHHPRVALRRDDPRPRRQHRLPLRANDRTRIRPNPIH